MAGRWVGHVITLQQGLFKALHRRLQAHHFFTVCLLAGQLGARQLQITAINHVALAGCCRTEDNVLQLPNIARPAIAQQQRMGRHSQLAGRAVDLLAGLAQKVLGQQQNIHAALTQRWHQQIEDVEAVVQILAEGALPHHALQVAVGSTKHSHIDLYFALAANAPKASIAEEPQQLGLQIR